MGGHSGGQSRISAGEAQALAELDRIWGTRSIVVDSPGATIPFNGFKDVNSNVVLIHVRSYVPVLVAAGHGEGNLSDQPDSNR